MWPRIESLTKVLVVIATIAAGLMALTSKGHAEDLNFAAIEGPQPATITASPSLDFSAIAGPPSVWMMQAAALDFTVLAQQPDTGPVEPPTAKPAPKRRLLCYGDPRTCGPCRQLKHEWESLSPEARAKLDYYLEFRESGPSWVESTPTIHWNTDDGPKYFDFSEAQLRGSFLNELDARYQATEKDVRQRRRDKVTGRYRGWQRRYADRAYDIAMAKLQEDPNISEADLREHVVSSMSLPPILLVLLKPVIEYVLAMILNYLRPTPPAPAQHRPAAELGMFAFT